MKYKVEKCLLKQSLNETNINGNFEHYNCAIFDFHKNKYRKISIENTNKLRYKIKSIATVKADTLFYEDTEEYLILLNIIKDFEIV